MRVVRLISRACWLGQERTGCASIVQLGAGAGAGTTLLAPRRGGDRQVPSAGGAGGLGSKPGVDALGMEAMAALRQDANELAVGELGKAYGAVEQRDAPRSGGGGGVERERGERADSLLFEALVGRSGEGDGGR